MSHWYDENGVLILQVPKVTGLPGAMRDTTLADARKMNLFPSTTTYLQILEKAQLTDWKVKRAINSALMGDTADVIAIMKDAFQIVEDAQDFGTQVHHGIHCGFMGERFQTWNPMIQLVVDGFWPWYHRSGLVMASSEQSFVDKEWGVAGTTDFVGTLDGKPVIADFKTQEFEIEKEGAANGPRFYDPEHPFQLASYDMGLKLPAGMQRMEVLLSRTRPGLVVTKIWKDNERYNRGFLALVRLWQLVKNYYPGTNKHWDGETDEESQQMLDDLEEIADNVVPFVGKPTEFYRSDGKELGRVQT